MADERFYIVVPRKVSPPADVIFEEQTENPNYEIPVHVMEPGRLMAQCAYAGRTAERRRAEHGVSMRFDDITTIVLQQDGVVVRQELPDLRLSGSQPRGLRHGPSGFDCAYDRSSRAGDRRADNRPPRAVPILAELA